MSNIVLFCNHWKCDALTALRYREYRADGYNREYALIACGLIDA